MIDNQTRVLLLTQHSNFWGGGKVKQTGAAIGAVERLAGWPFLADSSSELPDAVADVDQPASVPRRREPGYQGKHVSQRRAQCTSTGYSSSAICPVQARGTDYAPTNSSGFDL